MYLLYNHVKPEVDPLSPENVLFVGTLFGSGAGSALLFIEFLVRYENQPRTTCWSYQEQTSMDSGLRISQ